MVAKTRRQEIDAKTSANRSQSIVDSSIVGKSPQSSRQKSVVHAVDRQTERRARGGGATAIVEPVIGHPPGGIVLHSRRARRNHRDAKKKIPDADRQPPIDASSTVDAVEVVSPRAPSTTTSPPPPPADDAHEGSIDRRPNSPQSTVEAEEIADDDDKGATPSLTRRELEKNPKEKASASKIYIPRPLVNRGGHCFANSTAQVLLAGRTYRLCAIAHKTQCCNTFTSKTTGKVIALCPLHVFGQWQRGETDNIDQLIANLPHLVDGYARGVHDDANLVMTDITDLSVACPLYGGTIKEEYEMDVATHIGTCPCLFNQTNLDNQMEFLLKIDDMEGTKSIGKEVARVVEGDRHAFNDKNGQPSICPSCYRRSPMTVRRYSHTLPRTMVVRVNRMSSTDEVQSKRHDKIEIPFVIDLYHAYEFKPPPAATKFDLTALLFHLGADFDHGHLIAIVKSRDTWHVVDDGVVTAIATEDVMTTRGGANTQCVTAVYAKCICQPVNMGTVETKLLERIRTMPHLVRPPRAVDDSPSSSSATSIALRAPLIDEKRLAHDVGQFVVEKLGGHRFGVSYYSQVPRHNRPRVLSAVMCDAASAMYKYFPHKSYLPADVALGEQFNLVVVKKLERRPCPFRPARLGGCDATFVNLGQLKSHLSKYTGSCGGGELSAAVARDVQDWMGTTGIKAKIVDGEWNYSKEVVRLLRPMGIELVLPD